MTCDAYREHLSAWVDGELPPDLEEAVRRHLDGCPTCRATVDQLRATAGLVARLPARAAPPDLADAVEREIARASAGTPAAMRAARRRRAPVRQPPAWPRALAMAAAVLLVVGIGVLSHLAGPQVQRNYEAAGEAPVPDDALAMSDREAAPRAKRPTETSYFLALEHKARPAETAPLTPVGWDDTGAGLALGDTATWALEPVGSLEMLGGPEAVGPITWECAAAPPTAGAPITVRFHGTLSAPRGGRGNGALAAGPEATVSAPAAVRTLEDLPPLAMGGAGAPPAAPTPVPAGQAETASGRAAAAEATSDDEAVRVQVAMNRAAYANDVAGLRQVAKASNLAAAEQQLVVEAPTRDEGNRELLDLFARNNWSPVTGREATPAPAPAGKAGPGDDREAERADAPADPAPARGVYWLARQDGEDTWLVVADRDEVSRFAADLAQAERLEVSLDSSDAFLAVRDLRRRLRARPAEAGVAGLARTEAEGVVQHEDGPARRSGRAPGGAAPMPEEPKAASRPETGDAWRTRAPSAGAGKKQAKDEVAPLDAVAARLRDLGRYGGERVVIDSAADLPEGQVLLVIRVRPAIGGEAPRPAAGTAPEK